MTCGPYLWYLRNTLYRQLRIMDINKAVESMDVTPWWWHFGSSAGDTTTH
jgi:hypothetical protein